MATLVSEADKIQRRGLIALAQPNGPTDLAAAIAPLNTRRQTYLDLVDAHHLNAALVAALHQAERPVPEELATALAEHQIARLQLRRSLEVVLEALDDHLQWVVIKGPSIAAVMTRPELRTYNDLDLLIPGRYLAEAIDRLRQAGIRELNRNWVPYVEHEVGEVPMAGQYSTIDVHWDLVPLGWIRRSVRFNTAAMVDRARRVEVEGVGPVPTLEPVDQLLHLATHCALSGAVRLDQLRDLAVIGGRLSNPDDWNTVVERARSIGAARLAGHALDRANRAVCEAAPPNIVVELARSSLTPRRWIDRSPVGQRRATVAVWRDSRLESMMAVGRAVAGQLADRFGDGTSWDFGDKNSELYYGRQTGGDMVREQFLTMVERTSAENGM